MTTTTANAGAGATPATSATPASLPGTPKGDTSSAAPTETTTPVEPSKPVSIADRIRQQREEANKATSTTTEPGDAEGADRQAEDTQPNDAVGEKAGEKKDDGNTEAKAEADTKSEPDSVPMKAFKERIGRLNNKVKELGEQVAAKDLAVRHRDAAIEMLKSEVQRLQEALEQGQTLDPRDEKIRALEFQRRADELKAKLLDEHQKALAQQAEQLRFEERRSVVTDGFRKVLDKYPLVSGPELRAAAAKQLGDNPDMPAEDIVSMLEAIAARIEEQRLEKAKGRLQPAEKPPAPKFVKPSNGQAAGYQYPATADGIAAWLRSHRASRTSS